MYDEDNEYEAVQCQGCEDSAVGNLSSGELRMRRHNMSNCEGCDRTLCEDCLKCEFVGCDACGDLVACLHACDDWRWGPGGEGKPWEVKGCGARGCQGTLTRSDLADIARQSSNLN